MGEVSLVPFLACRANDGVYGVCWSMFCDDCNQWVTTVFGFAISMMRAEEAHRLYIHGTAFR